LLRRSRSADDSVPVRNLRWRRADPIVEGDLPRFRHVGSEIGPLGHANNQERANVRGAFSPTRPINDLRLFAGRRDALQFLIRSIEELNLHVILYGERGIGKTSMLHVLTQLAREARYRVVYHSCGEEQTFSEVFRQVAGEVPLLYDDRFDAAAEESERGGTLADLLPAGNFNASQLTEAFSHLSGTRVLILLDEFDRSAPGAFRRNIAELIKNLSDRSLRVQLVVAGVAGNLAELIGHIPSIRRNIYGLRVPDMTTDEIGEMIQIGETVSGLTFSEGAKELIGRMANGSPYLASLLAQYAGFCALDDESMEVSSHHIDAAREQVAEELRQRLPDRAIVTTDRALEAERGPVLLLLSGLSMRAMGRLDASAVQPHFKAVKFIDVAEDLKNKYDLLVEEPLEGDHRFVFAEEAVPVYLWMKLVGSNSAVVRSIAETAPEPRSPVVN
jgi:Cdc6-like AAA superfamily ATPase